MKPERGYFKWIGDQIKWVASKHGNWFLDPVNGLRKERDPFIIAGSDLLKEIDKITIEKAKNYRK